MTTSGTTVARTPDATRCPDCRSLLTGTEQCGACGLHLQGPPAVRLWALDVELLGLEDHREDLLAERAGLLGQLRASRAGRAGTAYAVTPAPGTPAPGTPAPGTLTPGTPAATPAAAPEWTPHRVQNTLLSLGGLLLAIAALVFTAVTYERLGAGGRAAVLLVLTALAALAAPRALRRGLSATAETVTAVALVLAALDAYGLRKLGLAGDSGPLNYAAGSAAVLSAAATGYAFLVPVRLAGAAAVVLAQLPVLLVLLQQEPAVATASLWLAELAAADLVVLAVLSARLRTHVRVVLVACTALVTGTGLLLGAVADGSVGLSALALLAHAAVLVGAGALVRDPLPRLLLWAAPVVVLAKAAHDVAAPELTAVQSPLVLGAVALLTVQAAALLPRASRTGPVAGALVVAGTAVVAVGESALTGVLLPLTWTWAPWTLAPGASARQAVGVGETWDGSVVTTVVLAAAAVTTGAAGLVLGRVRQAVVPAAALVAVAAVLLPLGLALTFPTALVVLLVVAAALLAAGALAPAGTREGLLGAGSGIAVLAAAWSLADRETTLVTVGVAALLLTGAASRSTGRQALTATAAVLATGELAAVGAARDLAPDQVGGLLLVAVAALLGLAAVLDRIRALALEVVAVGAGLLAVGLAAGDPGWLSWVLAGCALAALATALRPDRRAAAVAGGLLLSASSWVRLADADVTAPEPYVLPLAAVALVLGHLRRRSAPATRSWPAYAPGLSVLLLPSLLASFDDDGLTRALLVGAAALAVLLLGVRERLQAPLAIGAAVLAVDALQLLGPVAAALPRFVSIGAAGTLLLVVGATYEQRRREVSRLRASYDSLA